MKLFPVKQSGQVVGEALAVVTVLGKREGQMEPEGGGECGRHTEPAKDAPVLHALEVCPNHLVGGADVHGLALIHEQRAVAQVRDSLEVV